jgi:hypothetical protein
MPLGRKVGVRLFAPLAALSLVACSALPDILRELAMRGTGNAGQTPAPVASTGPSPGTLPAPSAGQSQSPPVVEPTTIAELLNATMTALLVADEAESARAILPYVHKSLKKAGQTELTADVRQFSFKKAHSNARFYAVPVQVTRVRENAVTGIGFGDTAEMGREEDHFLAKKEGVNGLPAPMTVFIPASGGPPKISYLGSL